MGKNSKISTIVKSAFSLYTPSIILICLPYFSIHLFDIYYSHFYSVFNLIITIAILILAQIFVSFNYKSRSNYLQFLSTLIIAVFIIFVYGFIIIDLINKIEIALFKYQIFRGRTVLPLILLLCLAIEFSFLWFKKYGFFVQNIFFLLLFVVVSTSYLAVSKKKDTIHSFKSDYKYFPNNGRSNKPIILIIADEYNSPDGLYQYFRDSSIYDFSNHLKKNGWLVKNSFYSNHASTIHSLSSLFNFNLSKDSNYAKMGIGNIGSEKLLKASFYDSVKKKNILITNYGIFDIGASKPITRLYYYPKNYLEQVLFYSVFPYIFLSTNSFELNGFGPDFYPMETHNRNILLNLSDSLRKINTQNSFEYVHLYMPHGPMVFEPEFKFKQRTTENYLAYWKFSNKKISQLLDSLIKAKECRIIITGDHGIRSDRKIDPHYTFSAFYGFDKANIDSLATVQDLGSLINSYFIFK
ncbi:MAG: sulfatase-like hydrolase/transferase [bacterium]